MNSKARRVWNRLGIFLAVCAAIYAFLALCAGTPFPSGHTLDFLSPVMKPYLEMGEYVYQREKENALPLAVIAGMAGAALLLLWGVKDKRQGDSAYVFTALALGAVAELLFIHGANAWSGYLLIAAFVLALIGSLKGRARNIKELVPPPSGRARTLLLLGVILTGLLFRAYHLDIRPPGHAHHASESGIISAQLSSEYPWGLSFEQLKRNIRRAVPLALSTEGGGTYGIPIILDWITFSIWKSNLVLQRGLSVVMGVLCIYVLFLLTEELFGSWTGLLAAFFMAVSPWHNAHSRYTQVIFSIAILFTLLSVYFVVKALRQRRLGWIVLAVLALAFDFYIYPSAQFIVFVLVLFWLYSMVRHREYWRRCLFCGLLTLIVVALLIAPRTHLFGPVSKIRLINNPVGQRADYATQSLQVAGLNIMKLAQSLLLKSTDMDTWFEKEGAILLWPVSIAFLCGLAWCLPRVGDTTYALLVLWFAIGVIPTIFSPNVFARRIICANPVIYMMAALSVMIGCAPLARALPARLKILRNLLAAAGLVLFSSAAFAAFYYHTVVYEERYHVEQRRIAEIVCENIQDYYVYLNYEPHQIEEDVWVYCGSYCPAGQEELPVTFSRKGEPAKEALPSLRVGPQGTVFGASSIGAGDAIIGLLKKAFPENERESHKELPVTFFQKEELENKVLPALRAGPKGTLFCVPANGDAIIGILKATFPEGKLEQYKLDKDYFDHSRGSPLCRTYAISREELSQRGEPHAPVALPRVEEAAPSREEHRASPTPTASPVRPARISGGARGEGPGEYNEPRGIALDNKGNVYVADFRNYRMQKFDRSGQFVLAWGGRGDGRGQFNDPCGVAVGGDGKVYVADTFNNRIQVFDRDGKYIFNFGGDFYAPRGIAVDRSGRIWVADSGNGVVKIFSGKGENIKVIGKKGKGNGEFDSPTGIAMDQKGNIYVADTGNKRVQILDKEGGYLREFPVDGWKQGAFNEPYLDVDSRGEVFLTDPPGNRVLRFSQKGKLAGTLAPMEESQPMLSFPMGIVVEKKGEAVYVVDCRHHRICKFSKKDFK